MICGWRLAVRGAENRAIADYLHRFARLEVRRNPSRREEIARTILAARRLFRMCDVVFPLRFVMINSVPDTQRKLPVVREELDAVGYGTARLMEVLLHVVQISLGRCVIAAPFDVGTEHDTHLVPNILFVLHHITGNAQTRGVTAFGKRQLKVKTRGTAHTARHLEMPFDAFAGWIDVEAGFATSVKLTRISFSLQPATRTRPNIDAIGRHIGTGIRRQHRIVLRGNLAPPSAHL